MADNSLPILNNKTSKRATKKRARWYRNPKLWRHGTMLFFFLFLLRVAYHHQKLGGGPNGIPSVEAYCPFGGLESLYQFLTTGGFIRRIEPSALILFGAVLILTLLFSRGFCGWICPFGSLQEWIGMLGKRVLGKRFNPTGKWDHYLRYLKYVILVLIISLTWWSGSLVFRSYDPFLAFFHLGEHVDELLWGYVFLGVSFTGAFFIDRFFCKYACPLGAVLGIVGKFGLTKVRRDEGECKLCVLCTNACPAHIEVKSGTAVTSAECNHCMDCVAACPRPNALKVGVVNWRFTQPVYGLVLVLGLLGMVGVSKATSVWRVKPDAIQVRDNSGELDAGAIRGWMTLADISTHYGIPLDRLYSESGVPDVVLPNSQIKNIHSEYEIDFEPEQLRDVIATLVAGSSRQTGSGLGQGPEDREGKRDQESDGPAIRGNMTLNEIVLQTGISKDALLAAAGLPSDVPARLPLRDWIHDYGVTPRDLRDIVDRLHAE